MILHSAARFLMTGDQIRLRGYLVDYTTFKGGRATGTRVSSESRTDSGNGACEVLYIDGFDKVGSPNRGWRITHSAGLIALVLGLVLYVALPVRADD